MNVLLVAAPFREPHVSMLAIATLRPLCPVGDRYPAVLPRRGPDRSGRLRPARREPALLQMV